MNDGHGIHGRHGKKDFTAETHDCREKVRPGSGREAGLGHAGVRAMHGAIAERTQRKILI
jgi:hypothetical protein